MPHSLLRRSAGEFVFSDGCSLLRLRFFSATIVRVTCTQGRELLPDRPSLIVTGSGCHAEAELAENGECYHVGTPQLVVEVSKATGALRYLDEQGRVFLAEPARGGRWLTPRKVNRNVFREDAVVAAGQSVDGARAAAEVSEAVFDREAFSAKLEFVFSEGEALYGLGSHEEGYGNLRGRSRELYQQNMKAVVPMLVSSFGYGVLLDCSSLMTFHDDALGSYWWAECVDELDYHVIRGGTYDAVMEGYRALTGPTPLPPKWAFGYAQSKERYVNAQELVSVVEEYRRRRIPLDLIVLDWKSWPNGAGWGQKSFDPARFPDPSAMTERLHQLGARLMVSIWPIMTGGCPDQRELQERGQMLGNRATYNAFLPEARATYWEQARRGLFAHGVDAWWCDCTEPFEADWEGAVKPEPHHRLAINTGQARRYLDEGHIIAYSLLHSQGIYEGQRAAAPGRRVLNLTRSSHAGQHRYATVTWNGDICGTWETLRRCIPEGLNFCATGEAYWTVDIGGFFVANDPKLWFWRGDYQEGCRGLTDMNALAPDPRDTGCRDLGFHELYTRWLQYAAFLPMFRSHGTDAAREVWRFGEEGTPFYDAIVAAIRLRYRFLPYLYSLAARLTRCGSALIRPLGLEFPKDRMAASIDDQFLLGSTLLVCPVTQPMLYGPGSRVLEGVAQTRTVYLPEGRVWHDFRAHTTHLGGRHIEVPAPLDQIPLFVAAGAIIPLTEPMQHVDEKPSASWQIRVYRGANGSFDLHEDDGVSYDYEQGSSALVPLHWDDAEGELTIGAREGDFPGLVRERRCEVVILDVDGSMTRQQLVYDGRRLMVR